MTSSFIVTYLHFFFFILKRLFMLQDLLSTSVLGHLLISSPSMGRWQRSMSCNTSSHYVSRPITRCVLLNLLSSWQACVYTCHPDGTSQRPVPFHPNMKPAGQTGKSGPWDSPGQMASSQDVRDLTGLPRAGSAHNTFREEASRCQTSSSLLSFWHRVSLTSYLSV